MTLPKVLVPIQTQNGAFHVFEGEPSQLDWPELRAYWQRVNVERPICFAPPEEKLDLFFFYACQKAGLPISLGTVFNPGWTDMFIGKIQHDSLVISSELAQYLAKRQLFAGHIGQLKQIVIVGDISQHAQREVANSAGKGTCHVLPHPVQKLTS